MDHPTQPPTWRPPRRQRLLGQVARGQGVRSVGLVVVALAIIAALWLSLAGNLAGARAAVYPRPQVALDISNPGGKHTINAPLSFTVRALVGRDLSYRWDFGDGSSASGPTASHTYGNDGHYTVQLTATDPTGQVANTSSPLTIYPPVPLANFSWTLDPTSPLLVDFSAQASSGDSLTYTWSFGDMVTGMQGPSDVQHAYEQPGTYKVTLTVTDSFDQSASSSQAVTVQVVSSQVSVTITPVAGSPRTYLFTASAPGNQLQFQWDFGDGATAIGASVRHTYLQSGTYTVVVNVITASSSNMVFHADLPVP